MEQDIQGAPPFPSGFEAVGSDDSEEAIRHLHFYNENLDVKLEADGGGTTTVTEDGSSSVGIGDQQQQSQPPPPQQTVTAINSDKASSPLMTGNNQVQDIIKVWTSAFYIAISAVPLEKGAITALSGRRRLVLDGPVFEFKNILDGWDKKTPDMTILVRDVKRDNLPEYLFLGKARPAKLKKMSKQPSQQQSVPSASSSMLSSSLPLSNRSHSTTQTQDEEEYDGKKSKINGALSIVDSDGITSTSSTTIRRSSITTNTEYSMEMTSNEEYSSPTTTTIIGNNV